MERVTTFGNVRKGDIVRRCLDGGLECVMDISRSGPEDMIVDLAPIERARQRVVVTDGCRESTGTRVILVYRPYAEGKTEQDMLKDIQHAFWVIVQAADWKEAPQFFSAFRDAVDAWELGKPQ